MAGGVVVGTFKVEELGVPLDTELLCGRSLARDGRGAALAPGIGVVTLVERLRINFPWTTMLSFDFFKSRVNISIISFVMSI
jgi:hypothetical protein